MNVLPFLLYRIHANGTAPGATGQKQVKIKGFSKYYSKMEPAGGSITKNVKKMAR